MSIVSEDILTIYDSKWAKKYGIAEKDIKWALKLIGEVTMETDYDEDDILATFLYLYHKNRGTTIPESIFDKIMKSSSKSKVKLVKFTKY